MSAANRLQEFQSFLVASRQLRVFHRSATTRERIVSFEGFRTAAINLLVARLGSDEVKQQLTLSLTALQLAVENSPPDVLAVAGLTFKENAYSELIRWAFCPRANGALAIACQRRWLARLGLAGLSAADDVAQVTSQIRTADGGIPDLIFRFPTWVLIVEAKTGTAEHITTDGNYQSESYPNFVQRELRLPDSMQVRLVLLTPDRAAAVAANAKTATYLEVAAVLAEAVQQMAPPPPVRAAYQLIIRHLATKAVRRELAFGTLAEALSSSESSPDTIRKFLIPLLEFKHLALGGN